MKKSFKHIAFDSDNDEKILSYCSANKVTYTKAVNELVKKSFLQDDILKILSEINSNLKYNIRISNLNFALSKQTYSDLAFENITDVNKSTQVNEFMKKVRTNKYED